MTFRKWAENYCYEKGMVKDQAEAIVEMAIGGERNEWLEGVWDDPIDNIKDRKLLLAALALVMDHTAVTWFKKWRRTAPYKVLSGGTAENL